MRLVRALVGIVTVACAASVASAQPPPPSDGAQGLATPPPGVIDRERGAPEPTPSSRARVSGDVDACWDPADFLPGAAPEDPELEAHRCSRDTVEIVELYVWGILFGLGTAGWVDDRLGLEDPAIQLGSAMVLGGAAALGIYQLDSGPTGLAPGVPTTIASGILLGLFEGVLGWSAFGNEPFTGDGVGTFYWGSTAIGAGLGLVVGLWRRPSVGDNALVRSGAMWGTFFAQMLKLTGVADDRVDTFRLLFTGYNAGIVAAAIATAVARPTRLQVFYMDLGGLAGMLAGSLLVGPAEAEDPTVGAVLGLTTAAGMALSVLLTMPDPPSPLAPDAAVEPLAMPVRGGAVVGARSRF